MNVCVFYSLFLETGWCWCVCVVGLCIGVGVCVCLFSV